mgnify:CR=1 FL=1
MRLDAQKYQYSRYKCQSIDNAEDREKFSAMLDRIGVDQPRWRELTFYGWISMNLFDEVGFPVLVRPSYVLSGAAMKCLLQSGRTGTFPETGSQCIEETSGSSKSVY